MSYQKLDQVFLTADEFNDFVEMLSADYLKVNVVKLRSQRQVRFETKSGIRVTFSFCGLVAENGTLYYATERSEVNVYRMSSEWADCISFVGKGSRDRSLWREMEDLHGALFTAVPYEDNITLATR